MFYLHRSNRTENLLRQLDEVLRFDDERDPFVPEYFLVQSQGMERMLSQHLAECFGVWCNYEYVLPTRFFARIAEGLGMSDGHEDYVRDRVCWRLDTVLRIVVKSADKRFTPLARYVTGDKTGVKRYQLAKQLAHVFDQYQIMRPEMLDAWRKDQLATDNPAELYQMELWNMIVASIGHSRHRGVFLRELIRLFDCDTDYSRLLPKRLSVFGLHSLPPILLSCIRALARHINVHFYLLVPCEHYWGEQTSRKAALRDTVNVLQEKALDPEKMPKVQPLLASLGQQGREFHDLLLDGVDIAAEFSSFEDPLDGGDPCLLHKLQSDLLRGEVAPQQTPLADDGSVLVVSAHSSHREMMILKDRILFWLDEDPGLVLKDIVVMAPDIQEYSGLIPAVFHDIPHSVADRNPAFKNNFLAAFLQFLDILSGRFYWSEVFDLLSRSEVHSHFEIDETDLDILRHWVVSSGIRWGISASQKDIMGLPGGGECTWRSGLDRLMMGYACGLDQDVDGVLPYLAIEGSMASPLGGLSAFCEVLEEASEQFRRDRTLLEWSELLGVFAGRLLGQESSDSLAELHRIVSDVGLEYAEIHRDNISFEVVRSWLEDAVEEKRSSSGFLRGQLTFCSMLPMRSIPFKKVCLLGLNDSVFPENDFHPPFNLLGDSFLPGDRSRRSDDRYQFLEAVLSARDSLYLSYVGQSIRSNDVIPPSVVVSELIEFVQLYGVADLVEKHPLQAYSRSYFSGTSSLFSYNKGLMGVAESLHGERDSVAWWKNSLPEPPAGTVSLVDFFSFFKNPQRYLVRNVMGICPGSDVSSGAEHEPFELDTLQNYLFDQELLEAELEGYDSGYLLRRNQVSGSWPLGRPGEIHFVDKQKEMRDFIQQVKSRVSTGKEDEIVLEAEVGGLFLSGKLGSFYGGGTLLFRYAKLKGKDLLVAWVHHCLAAVCLGDNRETRLLSKDMELVFPEGSAVPEDLEQLVRLFRLGQRLPSPLMVEPALAYALHKEKIEKGGKGNPLLSAKKCAIDILDRRMDGEWDLLYQGLDPDDFLGSDFVEHCNWVYESIWKSGHVRKM